ncbi:MAG: hypothetical protein NXI24_18765 [bacterium]|nr:hypothetical protein [bacterium]
MQRNEAVAGPVSGMEGIDEAIQTGKTIRLIAPVLNDSLSRRMAYVLRALVSHYERPELEDCLHSCLVELATNASRANMKHVFFLDRGFDLENPDEYARGLAEFRASRERGGWHKSLRVRARELGLLLEIVFRHSPDGWRIEVINNLALLPQDERRIREKLGRAMRTADIFEFFTEHGDDTEGQGLGFAMNVLFLRSENIDPSLLRIGSTADQTVARLEVPLSQNFVTLRGAGPSHSAIPA